MPNTTGYRRYLLYGLYVLLPVGAVVALALSVAVGTILLVAAVLGVVGVSVTGRAEH